jgi:hypothetical protein
MQADEYRSHAQTGESGINVRSEALEQALPIETKSINLRPAA